MMEMELVDELRVSCETCLKDVLPSESTMTEIGDRVVHFCGLGCYEEWTEQIEMAALKILTE